MKPLSDCKLYAFVDTTYSRGRRPDDLARQLCDGGADIIQLDEPWLRNDPEAAKRYAVKAINRALQCYRDRAEWEAMMRRGMARDFGWDHSMTDYAAVYRAAEARALAAR